MNLTARQQVILDLHAEGLQTKQVAAYMGVSTETIKWHLTQIRRKLEANNTTHAVAIYLRAKKASPHGNPTAQRAAAPLPPTLAGSRPTLLQKMSFRIIDAGRRWRITL